MTAGTIRALAVALSGLAGFVDALGFLSLGGFYVAFMSGNSTILSIGLATGTESRILLAAGLVACFVVGVAVGTAVGGRFGRGRVACVLVVVAGLLGVAWGLDRAGLPGGTGLAMALAMGVENTAFNRQGQAGIGLTYMTGTLVRLGQLLAQAVAGGGWGALLPDVLLWCGMLAGALLGAALWRVVGMDAIGVAVVASLVMAAVAWRAAGEPA